MPDLISQSFLYCPSVENFTSVKGSKNYLVRHGASPYGKHLYEWHCECDGFKYRKKCRHIEEAKKEYCGWDQFTDGEAAGAQCPRCGEKLLSREV